MVAEQPGAALQLLQSPPAPLHLSRKEGRRKGESSFRLSLSQPVAPLASYDAAQLAKGEGLSTASGSRKVLGNANASLGDGRRQSPLDNAILAAAVAAFAGPAGSSRPASGSSFDGSSSMATLNGVGSLPRRGGSFALLRH